jgi:hypothetical protein
MSAWTSPISAPGRKGKLRRQFTFLRSHELAVSRGFPVEKSKLSPGTYPIAARLSVR